MSDPVLAPIGHEEFVVHVRTLAGRIMGDADWRPDFIVGIGRGGLTPAVYLSHAIGVPVLSIDHSTGVPEFASELMVALLERCRAGARLLFVDDINDSGRTIGQLRVTLAEPGVAKQARFAVLIDNVSSRARVDYSARTIDRRTNKDWFVFPWEAVAPRSQLVSDSGVVPERLA